MNSTDRLTEELRRQARGLSDQHPLTLQDVQGRARGLRRRRHAVTGLAAAAVLAVVVPLGLAAGDYLDRSAEPVGDPVPSVERPQQLSLTTDVEEATAPPATPYAGGDAVHLPDGSTLSVPSTYDTLVPLGDDWLVGGDAGDGARFAAMLDDATGSETERFATLGRFAVSPDGSLAAYVRPEDGAAMVLDSNGVRRQVTVTAPDTLAAQEPFTIVAVHPCNAVDACLLIADLQVGGSPVAVQVDRDGTQRNSGYLKVGDRSVDGTVAGRVTSGESGSVCSSVRPPQGQGWDTCRWELGRFSPDGRFVVGSSLEDGRGPRTLVLLDARDGTLLREFAASDGTDLFVRQAVWESADSVLATVWDSDHWSVLRMGVDGSLTRLPVEGVDGAGDPDAPPVFLAARPPLS